jgi:hypothetical protein
MGDLVTVFETGDPVLVALARSLLDSARIEFATKGEAIQDLLGLGRFPAGSNLVTGPVVFQVQPDDALKARSLLRDLQRGEQSQREPPA